MACGNWVPMTLDHATEFTLRSLKCIGIWRPCSTSPLLPINWQTSSCTLVPRHRQTPVSRSAWNTQSPFCKGYAEPVTLASWPVAMP